MDNEMPHLQDAEQLQLDADGHVLGVRAVDEVTCALHQHRQPAAHPDRLRIALARRPRHCNAVRVPTYRSGRGDDK